MAGSCGLGQSESALVAVKMSARTGEQNDGGAARRVVPREVLHCHSQFARITCWYCGRRAARTTCLSESLRRRIWRELVSAVEWTHAGFLFHRDIKLLSKPLVKLTDFRLARKIDPDDSWLCTRCGSESYPAPELLVAAHSTADAEPSLHILSRAPSDAHGSTHFAQNHVQQRLRNVWALGVVLFALVTRALPLDPPLMLDAKRARRRRVVRIVQGEWTWPAPAIEWGSNGIRVGNSLLDDLEDAKGMHRDILCEVLGRR
ncbi:Protein kinase-like domain containing protein [Lactarius tabidus]